MQGHNHDEETMMMLQMQADEGAEADIPEGGMHKDMGADEPHSLTHDPKKKMGNHPLEVDEIIQRGCVAHPRA